jgi:hypothetical protein
MSSTFHNHHISDTSTLFQDELETFHSNLSGLPIQFNDVTVSVPSDETNDKLIDDLGSKIIAFITLEHVRKLARALWRLSPRRRNAVKDGTELLKGVSGTVFKVSKLHRTTDDLSLFRYHDRSSRFFFDNNYG